MKGIKQGTLHGYDLVLMAPEEDRSEIINEFTLEKYQKEMVEGFLTNGLTYDRDKA